MPRLCAQVPRLTAWAGATLLLAACSGGGSGGGGAAPAGASASAQTTSVTLAWSHASGPVSGYAVYVQRDEGVFKHETDVSAPRVVVSGPAGSTARVIVVGFDAANAQGPMSPSSPRFTFPEPGPSTQAANQAAGSVAAASASVASSTSVASGSGSDLSALASTASESAPPALPGTLVWADGDVLRLTDTALQTTRLFMRPADALQLAGVADFDGDGQDDLLWVSASAQLSYTSGSALTGGNATSPISFGALAADERVIGAGDFDGDGDGDVLVAGGDAIRVRLTAPDGPAIVELGTASQAVLVGIADFDANGSEDIVWRSSSGALVIWLLDHGSFATSVELALATDLVPLGAGDFDGDGMAELMLRDANGVASVVHPLLAQPQLEPTELADTSAWQPAGAADVEGDASDELVLAAAGEIRIASLSGDEVISLEPGSTWQLVALLP